MFAKKKENCNFSATFSGFEANFHGLAGRLQKKEKNLSTQDSRARCVSFIFIVAACDR
jgi:hypothetical protein